jgi:hypothetical protein
MNWFTWVLKTSTVRPLGRCRRSTRVRNRSGNPWISRSTPGVIAHTCADRARSASRENADDRHAIGSSIPRGAKSCQPDRCSVTRSIGRNGRASWNPMRSTPVVPASRRTSARTLIRPAAVTARLLSRLKVTTPNDAVVTTDR